MAIAWAKAQKTTVRVVHVIEVTRSLPLNAEMEFEARRGEHLLRKAQDLVHDKDLQIHGELLQSRQAGQALVDEAHQQQVQAIVLGIGFKQVFGDYQLGPTASYALKHARCPVWLVREAAKE